LSRRFERSCGIKYYADFNIGSDECHGLVRVHCADDADHDAFMVAKAERWTVPSGWVRWRDFQMEYVHLGEDTTRDYAPLPADRVEQAMQSMRERYARW
jgi:hypothetical protein